MAIRVNVCVCGICYSVWMRGNNSQNVMHYSYVNSAVRFVRMLRFARERKCTTCFFYTRLINKYRSSKSVCHFLSFSCFFFLLFNSIIYTTICGVFSFIGIPFRIWKLFIPFILIDCLFSFSFSTMISF